MKKWMFRLVVIVCLLFGATGINTTAQAAEAWAGEDGVAGFVTRMYQTCLGREPDAAGLNDWVTRLKAGESKGADIAFGFIFSAEFSNMNLCNSC